MRLPTFVLVLAGLATSRGALSPPFYKLTTTLALRGGSEPSAESSTVVDSELDAHDSSVSSPFTASVNTVGTFSTVTSPTINTNTIINTKQSTLLYIPNLIGYLRIFLLLLSTYYATLPNPRILLFSSLYATSALLDAVDGFVARALNQCSNLGSVLDMITDRLTTASLCIILTQYYPKYTCAFILAISLDVGEDEGLARGFGARGRPRSGTLSRRADQGREGTLRRMK